MFLLGHHAHYKQCSKLRFYFVHLPSALTPKMVHPAFCLCVTHYSNLFESWEKHAHTRCPGFKILFFFFFFFPKVSKSMHPAAKMCTQGAGCIGYAFILLQGCPCIDL